MNKKRAHIAIRFLRWFCHPDLIEDLEGDLLELHQEARSSGRKKSAHLQLWLEVIRLLRPGIIHNGPHGWHLNHSISYFLKLSVRNLRRNRFYTTVNLLGLTLAFSGILGIIIWIQHLDAIDEFHDQVEDIYGTLFQSQIGDKHMKGMMAPIPAGPLLMDELPEVIAATFTARHFDGFAVEVRSLDKRIYEENQVMVTDSNFFKVFTFPILKGDPTQALKFPDQVVISQTIAAKFFPEENPIGKTLTIAQKEYRVSAIIKIPHHSQMQFGYLISRLSFPSDHYLFEWDKINFPLYFRLSKEASPSKIQNYITTHFQRNVLNPALAEFAQNTTYELIPYKEIKYLDGLMYYPHFLKVKGLSKKIYRYLLISMAVILFVVAILNFFNLTILQIEKSKKSGFIMRLLGTAYHSFIKRWVDLYLLLFLSQVFSLLIVWNGLQLLNIEDGGFLIRDLFSFSILSLWFGSGLAISIILTLATFILGREFYLFDRFKRNVLHFKSIRHGWSITFQLAVSSALIMSTFFIFKQFQLLTKQNLGFEQDQIIVVSNSKYLENDAQVLKQNLIGHHVITAACLSDYIPSNTLGNNVLVMPDQSEEHHLFARIIADSNFLDVYQPNVVWGKSKLRGNWCLTNEAGLTQLGGPDILASSSGFSMNGRKYQLNTVIENPLFEPLQYAPRPIMIYSLPDFREKKLSIKVRQNHLEEAIEVLEEEWDKVSDLPLKYEFLNQNFARLYSNEKVMGTILFVFSFISCLIGMAGLLAVTLNLIESKTKEIAIRKVNGAPIIQIAYLISKNLIKWIIFSLLMGVVSSYLLVQKWAHQFIVQVQTGWVEYVMISICIIILACLSTGYYVLKAGLANPVESLRNE